MRHPIRLLNDVGLKDFCSFQLIIGGTFFTILLNPIYWIMTTLWYLFHLEIISTLFPTVVFFLGAICLYFGNFAFVYINVAGLIRRKYYDMVKYALISPIYWGLMSIGAWKGLFQLITKPHFWEKTKHGLAGSGPQNSEIYKENDEQNTESGDNA